MPQLIKHTWRSEEHRQKKLIRRALSKDEQEKLGFLNLFYFAAKTTKEAQHNIYKPLNFNQKQRQFATH